MGLNKTRVNETQSIFQMILEVKAHRGLHKKLEGAMRIKVALNHASNLPVRRRRAADSANFASGRHMPKQVWRHKQGEQLLETPPQRSQTPAQQQLGGKLMRYITAWDANNQRLQQTIVQCLFQGNQTEMQAYKTMLKEEQYDGITEEIPKEQVKWWNPAFLVPKLSGEGTKILDASLLNEEIQLLHFQMKGVEQVRYLPIPNDWTVTFDLKSAFHHLIVYPPYRAYLAFKVDNHHYQYRTMPIGCNHFPIFFIHALTHLLTEIPLNQCQLKPKQEIDFLGWTLNMTETNIFMTKDRRYQLIEQVRQFIKSTQSHKIIKIKETAALIGRLNFLRTQFREASLYLMLIDSAKT
ncbi:MAG: hypothetical protein EZS28_016212 [Streblomastix strix]|uniref:Reverse transcriptase domain-containing protein n=1 Tax=Streblomastix strix TaxID=222440 RepID=A0A5J4W0V8_9EUKA|nr:MAG: hypothetical protein EZS28_016212 [Streblomastix strix]